MNTSERTQFETEDMASSDRVGAEATSEDTLTQANEPPGFEHERVVLHHGTRSGLPVIVAVHSTRLGAAVGGTRMWNYPHWSSL